MANGTDTPASKGWVASGLETVLRVKGSQVAPVEGHQLVGVSVTHTAPVFLKSYMASLSGGDWSLRPTGAVIFEGTKDASVSHCIFNGVGGNGVAILNYNRNTTVADSEFVWVGESGIISVGSTDRIDGTKGDQPRGNQILRNLVSYSSIDLSLVNSNRSEVIRSDVPRINGMFTTRCSPRLEAQIHEVGIFGKQTAGYVQAMSCQTTLKHNVMFNGP